MRTLIIGMISLISRKLKSAVLSLSITCIGFIYPTTAYGQFLIYSPPSSCQVIEDIDVDGAGRILFATDDGILILDTNQTWLHFNSSNGLTNSHVIAIKHDANKIVFSEINKRVGTCNYLTASDSVFNSSFNYGYVSALHIDNSGNTLLGTDNGAVFLLNNTGAISLLNLGLTLGTVNHIVYITNPPVNSTNFYGITSSNKGVLFDLPSNQTQLVISTATTPLPNNNIISSTYVNNFAYDGTAGGLFIVNFTNFPSVGVSIMKTTNTPLPNDTINAVAVSGTSLFLGTPSGLAVRVNNIWKTYNTQNSNLPSNNIAELALDQNDLWIGTKQGHICKIDSLQLVSSIDDTDASSGTTMIYLNPDNSDITMHSSSMVDGYFSLYDLNGNLVLKDAISTNKNIISAKNYPEGLYFYHLVSRDGKMLKTGKLFIPAL